MNSVETKSIAEKERILLVGCSGWGRDVGGKGLGVVGKGRGEGGGVTSKSV